MNSLNRDLIPGEVVVIAARYLPDTPHPADRQFRCTGGFGMKAATEGEAIFGEFVTAGGRAKIHGSAIDVLETERLQKREAAWQGIPEAGNG